MRFAYTLSIYAYRLLIYFASFFNEKAKKWIEGRKNWKQNIRLAGHSKKPVCWIHCASLGEFEQARPIIEELHKQERYFILLSFFSPSGYDAQKDYAAADLISYLPIDSPSNAKKFIELGKIKLALFVKYEFWFNYLSALQKASIPYYLISGIFRQDQHFFSWYGAWFRKQLKGFEYFFVQNTESAELLKKIGVKQVMVAKDTRFDRVLSLSKADYTNQSMESFRKDSFVLALGSSWEAEHEFALKINADFPEIKLLIAPHEIQATKLNELASHFDGPVSFSSQVGCNGTLTESRVFILDEIGLLSNAYRFADAALIGGGFGAGIHNTLEAATFGIPVLFGPKYQKFQEAKDLINCKAAESITDYESLKTLLRRFIQDPDFRIKAGQNAAAYVQENSGASSRIIQYLNSGQTS